MSTPFTRYRFVNHKGKKVKLREGTDYTITTQAVRQTTSGNILKDTVTEITVLVTLQGKNVGTDGKAIR